MLIDGRHRVGLSIMFGIVTEDEDGGDLEGRGGNFVELPASPGRTEVKKRADGEKMRKEFAIRPCSNRVLYTLAMSGNPSSTFLKDSLLKTSKSQ